MVSDREEQGGLGARLSEILGVNPKKLRELRDMERDYEKNASFSRYLIYAGAAALAATPAVNYLLNIYQPNPERISTVAAAAITAPLALGLFYVGKFLGKRQKESQQKLSELEGLLYAIEKL